MRRMKNLGIAAVGMTAVIALAGCSGSGATEALDPDADLSQQTLTISTWPEYYPENLAEEFEAATGVKLTIVHHATNEEAVAKVSASADSGIDVVFLAGNSIQLLAEESLAAPLDHSAVPNLDDMFPVMSEMDFDPGLAYSVPYAWGTTGLCYRSDLLDAEPTSWEDLIDPAPEAVGKTTILDDMRWAFVPGLKSLGYSVNSTDEAEIEAAGEQLQQAASNALAFDNATYGDKLVAGESILSHGHDGWCNMAAAQEPAVKFVVPEEGSELWVDGMVLLKSSKNAEAAHAFMDYLTSVETQSWIVENLGYNVPNQVAVESLPEEIFEKYPALIRDDSALASSEQIEEVGDAIDVYNRVFTEVKAS